MKLQQLVDRQEAFVEQTWVLSITVVVGTVDTVDTRVCAAAVVEEVVEVVSVDDVTESVVLVDVLVNEMD